MKAPRAIGRLALFLFLTPLSTRGMEANSAKCYGYVLAKAKAEGLASDRVEELEPFFKIYYSMRGNDWDSQKAEGISALKTRSDEQSPTPFEIDCNQLFLEVAKFTQKAIEKYGDQ